MAGVLFFLTTVFSMLLFYQGAGKDKWILLIFPAWLTVSGSLAYAGVFVTYPLMLPVAMSGSVLIVLFILKRSKQRVLHPAYLLAVHVLRIPVELGLYQLFLQKQVPVLMTFAGWNYDILFGISAALLLLSKGSVRIRFSRRFYLGWNIAGLLFLFVIVLTAILCAPLPIQQLAFDQPNTAVLYFPYCFLPLIIVPLVLMSHILLVRHYRIQTDYT